MDKKDIKNLSLEELKEAIIGFKEPAYRAEQIFSWLYKKGALEFCAMANMPKGLIKKLEENYLIGAISLAGGFKSIDKTEKFLFRLSDGNFIETVLICAKSRKTICISTQVGCKFGCSFCASGAKGFTRNLTSSEITNQILFLQFNLKHKATNYVFMGMGEPLDNLENVVRAIGIMNNPKAMDIGIRRITVSTCGIVPGIEKLKLLGKEINLSVSLHSADCALRSELMPINKRYPLKELIAACESYIKELGRMITLEYILIKGKNDSAKETRGIVRIAKLLNAKVNLIPYSPVSHAHYQSSSKEDMEAFAGRLIKSGVAVTIRESKGKDIQAACGQLACKRAG